MSFRPASEVRLGGLIAGKAGSKGGIAKSANADIILLDSILDIARVYAKGKLVYADGKAILKGRFEK